MRGWTLSDNTETDLLPAFSIPPGGVALLVAQPQTLASLAGQAAVIVVIEDGYLGNGLANVGDRVVLRDASCQVLDVFSLGSAASVNDPSCPAVSDGHSLQRGRQGQGEVCAFQDNPLPSPGRPNLLPTPTATGTPTPSSTPTPSVTPSPLSTPTSTATLSPALSATPIPTEALVTPQASSPIPEESTVRTSDIAPLT